MRYVSSQWVSIFHLIFKSIIHTAPSTVRETPTGRKISRKRVTNLNVLAAMTVVLF